MFVNTTLDLTNGSPPISSGFATAALDVPVEFLDKVFLDDPVGPGNSVTLQFTIQNPSRTEAATSIAFTDDLTFLMDLTAVGLPLTEACDPDGPAGSPGTGTLSGTTSLSFAGGSLPAEGSCTFSVALDVPGGATPATYTNTTTAITATIDGEVVVGNTATDELVVTLAPTLTKEFLTNPVGAGGTTTLRFTITNNSSTLSLEDIEFEDVFDDVLPTASDVPTNPVCGGTASFTPFFDGGEDVGNFPAKFTLTGASLSASESCTIDVTLDVVTNATTGTYPNTTSPISGLLDGEESVEGFPASDDLMVVGGPSLIKEFTDDLTFLTDLTAVGLPLTEACDPDGPGGSPGTGTLSGTTLLDFSGATLAPGESCTFSVTLDVPGTAPPGLHTNTSGTVTATEGGIAVTGNPASEDLRIVGLTLTKEFLDDPVLPGETVTLEFVIENVSPTETATAITIYDDMSTILGPPGSPGDDITGDGVTVSDVCGSGNGTLTWASLDTFMTFSGGTLAPGEMCMFSVVLDVPASAVSGTYPNSTGTKTGPGFFALMPSPTFVVFDEATDELIVNNELLSLTKEFTDDPVAPGGTGTLKFTLTNLDSTEMVEDIAFTDDLDAALAGLVATGLPPAACGGTVITPDGGMTIELTGGSLAGGEMCMFDVSFVVPATALSGTIAVNTTGPVTGTTANPGLDVTGGPATGVLQIGSMTLTKSFDGPTEPGGTPTLTFTIENLSASTVTDLAFADDLTFLTDLTAVGLPLMEACDPDGPGGSPGTGTLSGTTLLNFSGATLAPGESCTFDIDLLVPGTDLAGSFVNTTSSLTVLDGLPVAIPATANLTVNPVADLSVTKGDGVTTAVPGQTTLIYTIIATNSGPSTDPSVTLMDTFPSDLTCTFTSAAAGGATGNTASGSGNLSETLNMPPGSMVTYTVMCTIDSAATGTLSNTATISGSVTDNTSGNDSATDSNTVLTPQTDLAIVKDDAGATFVPGSNITYTLTVTNNGPSDSTGGTVTDVLPAGVTFVSSPTGCTEAGGTVTCTVPALANTANFVHTFIVMVDAGQTATIINTATVAANETDPVAANDSASEATPLLGVETDMSISKDDGVISVVPGTNLTYTLTVTNNGPSNSTGGTVTDVLPAGVTFVSSPSGCTEVGGMVTCPVPALTSGDNVALTFVVMVASGQSTPITNTATVAANETDPTGANDSDAHLTALAPAESDLSIDKDSGGNSVMPGAQLTFTLTVTNNGPSDSSGGTVTDVLPAGLTFVSSDSGCTEAGGTVSCPFGAIANGDNVALTFVVMVAAEHSTPITNTATVAGNESDPDSSNNSATAGAVSVGVSAIPLLSEWGILLLTALLALLACWKLQAVDLTRGHGKQDPGDRRR